MESRAFLIAQLVKNPPAKQETWVRSIPGLGRSSGEGKGYPLWYSGLENSMGCIYSPWGHNESDTTGQLFFFMESRSGERVDAGASGG